MAQRSGCAALALAQVRIRDRQELDFVGNCTCTYCTFTWLAPVLYPYSTIPPHEQFRVGPGNATLKPRLYSRVGEYQVLVRSPIR